MSDKSTSGTEPENGSSDARPEVDTSRRRFTAAGLSTSAILTLASRSALGGASCSVSGTLSGNTSMPGAVACAGWPPEYYQFEQTWPTGFDCGKKNPLALGQLDYSYPAYTDVEAAIEGGDEALKMACVEYREWAWPTWATAPTTLPNPTPPPSKFNEEFAGTGLAASDPELTLMQALTEYAGDVPGHAVAALFNTYVIGPESFGYTPNSLKQFIREADPSELLAHLELLNTR